MMLWHSLDKKEVLKDLDSSEGGLSNDEALRRLRKYGSNELKEIGKTKPYIIFLQQFKSVFIMILIFAALFSLMIKHYLDFSVIFGIVFLNSIIGFFQEYRAEKTISEMREILTPKVKVMRNNELFEISSKEIVPGDILILSEGDRVMADCRLLHVTNLQVNEAVLSGESFPQNKSSAKLNIDLELSNRENMIYAGTSIVRGNARAVVVSTGMKTEFGKIASLVQKVKHERTPLEKKLDHFSKKVAIVISVLITVSVIIGFFRGENFFNLIFMSVALAVSVIPEGIPAVVAITFAIAIKRMQKHNTLIKKLPAVETLGRTTVICTDKTGTLTEEEMTVKEAYSGGKKFRIENSSFFSGTKKINPLHFSELFMLLKIGVLCNNARAENDSGKIRVLGDPTERAFINSAYKAGISKKKETEIEKRVVEYSFSSRRKLMSVVRINQEMTSYVKGAPDVLLQYCNRELVDGKFLRLTIKRKKELLSIYEKMASDALRVLGFAFKSISPSKLNQKEAETGLIFVGFQGMIDPPRKEVPGAIKDCLNAGIKVKMLTGDSILTASAIAHEIGLRGKSISGHELSKLPQNDFDRVVQEYVIFGRIDPQLKLEIIKSLKKQKEITAVTGDGINDVLALKEAHIGIAMGKRGTDVAREVSDMILLDDNFHSIAESIREGRLIYDNLKKSIKAYLSSNMGELLLILFAVIISIPLPILPLAILWMNLITDSFPVLSLSEEPEEKNIMKRPPINPNEPLLNGMVKFIILAGIFSFIASFGLFYLYYHSDLTKARTLALTALIFCEMFVILSCRSSRPIKQVGGILSNKILSYSILLVVILQLLVVYSPLASIFGLKPLSLFELSLTFLVSFPILVFFEIMKAFKIKI